MNRRVLPKHIAKVQELAQYFNSTTIQIIFSVHDLDDGISKTSDPITCSIFGISAFNDKIQNERYEDAIILFDTDSNQLFNVEEFINSGLLPEIIVNELSDFYNLKPGTFEFSDNNDLATDFVLLKTGVWTGDKINGNVELMQGHATAFESWSNLRDCVEQLEFVIAQWLKNEANQENFTIEKWKMYQE
jgi:hypothetical protein